MPIDDRRHQVHQHIDAKQHKSIGRRGIQAPGLSYLLVAYLVLPLEPVVPGHYDVDRVQQYPAEAGEKQKCADHLLFLDCLR